MLCDEGYGAFSDKFESYLGVKLATQKRNYTLQNDCAVTEDVGVEYNGIYEEIAVD